MDDIGEVKACCCEESVEITILGRSMLNRLVSPEKRIVVDLTVTMYSVAEPAFSNGFFPCHDPFFFRGLETEDLLNSTRDGVPFRGTITILDAGIVQGECKKELIEGSTRLKKGNEVVTMLKASVFIGKAPLQVGPIRVGSDRSVPYGNDLCNIARKPGLELIESVPDIAGNGGRMTVRYLNRSAFHLVRND